MNNINPHSADLRRGRHSDNNQIYLLTTVTYQRQNIFTDFVLARIVVQAMQQEHQEQKIESLLCLTMCIGL